VVLTVTRRAGDERWGHFPVTPLSGSLSETARCSHIRYDGTLSIVDDEAIAAQNACRCLFLTEIEELDNNGLRLVVRKGRPVGAPESVLVSDAVISGGIRIDVTDESSTFELVWERYRLLGHERVVCGCGR
jgi:hypothetical protein